MKKILGVVAVVAFMTVSLGVGSIYAQEKDKKPAIMVEDEHAKIAQRHKEFIQKMNLSKQDKKLVDKEKVVLGVTPVPSIKLLNPVIDPKITAAQPENIPLIMSSAGKISNVNNAGTNAVITRTVTITVTGILKKVGDASIYMERATDLVENANGRVICLINDTQGVLPPHMRGSYVTISSTESKPAVEDRQIAVFSSIASFRYASDLDHDGDVDQSDRDMLMASYGKQNWDADVSGDGLVNATDLSILNSDFGKSVVMHSNEREDSPAFKALDTNGDLYISGDEAVNGLQAFGKTYRKSAGEDGYNALYDFDGSGKIAGGDFGYLSSVVGNLDPVAFASVRAFKALDTNGDLQISGDEAVNGLQAFGKTYRKSAGEDGYNALYDFDGSGKIAGGDFGYLSSLVSNLDPDAVAAVAAFKAQDTNGDLQIDEKVLRAPLIEYEDGKVASLTIFGSDGKPAYRYAYGADGKIKYTVNYDKDAGLGDEFVLKAPLIEYKDGKIASLTIFGNDGKPADKYTFDENGRIIENVHYGSSTIFGNDVNGDGKIDESDIEAVRSHTGAVIGNPLYSENADLNHDGRITGTDVVLLRNAINEKNLRMPVKEPYEGDSPGKKPVIVEPEKKILENIPDGLKPIYAAKGTAVYDKLINAGYKPAAHVSVNSGGSYEMFFVPQYEDFVVPSISEKEKPGAAGYPHPSPPDLNRIIGNDDDQKPGPSKNVRYDNAAEFSEMKDVENKIGAQMQSNVQISRTMAGDTQGQGEMLPLQKPE